MKLFALSITTVACVLSFYASILFGTYLAYQSRSTYSNPDLYTAMENIATIPQDWSTKPLVSLHVVPDASVEKCPVGYEDVFTSVWEGTMLACECNKGKYTGESGTFTLGTPCVYSSFGLGSACITVPAWPAVNLSII